MADLILTCDDIITLDPGRRAASAVAIAGGRITAIGDRSDVRDWRDNRTEVIDLGGATLTPGLTDLLEEGAMRLVRSVIPAEPFAARRDRLAANRSTPEPLRLSILLLCVESLRALSPRRKRTPVAIGPTVYRRPAVPFSPARTPGSTDV